MKQITSGLMSTSLKKGTYIWHRELEDFTPLTILGGKPPTKKDKWAFTLETHKGTVIEGTGDYNTARIIHLMSDKITQMYKKEEEGVLRK